MNDAHYLLAVRCAEMGIFFDEIPARHWKSLLRGKTVLVVFDRVNEFNIVTPGTTTAALAEELRMLPP